MEDVRSTFLRARGISIFLVMPRIQKEIGTIPTSALRRPYHISSTMAAMFFVSGGSSLMRRLILYFLLSLIHFQFCLCFSFDRAQSRTIHLPINGSKININNRIPPFIVHARSIESSDDFLGREALSSIRVCCQTAAAAAVIDGITLNWSSLRQGRSWKTLVGLLGTFWKVGIAASLYRVFTIYQKYIKKKEEETLFQPIYFLCKTMARLWLEASWFLAFGCFVDLVDFFEEDFSWAISFAILIPVGLCFQRVSNLETEELAGSVDESEGAAAAARQMGLVTARNMAYCTSALLVRASIIPLSALYQPTWRDRTRQILGLPSLVVTGALLWQLRKSFLTALLGATSLDLKPEVKKELFEAQISFYSNVAATFESEAIFKLGFFLVQIAVTNVKARKLVYYLLHSTYQ
jgi:hypothetical protein